MDAVANYNQIRMENDLWLHEIFTEDLTGVNGQRRAKEAEEGLGALALLQNAGLDERAMAAERLRGIQPLMRDPDRGRREMEPVTKICKSYY